MLGTEGQTSLTSRPDLDQRTPGTRRVFSLTDRGLRTLRNRRLKTGAGWRKTIKRKLIKRIREYWAIQAKGGA